MSYEPQYWQCQKPFLDYIIGLATRLGNKDRQAVYNIWRKYVAECKAANVQPAIDDFELRCKAALEAAPAAGGAPCTCGSAECPECINRASAAKPPVVHHGKARSWEWNAFIVAMRSGQQFECDRAMFDYWLGVLPPVFMNKTVEWPDGQKVSAAFGFAEGIEPITAFWEKDGRFFGRRSNLVNRPK